MLKALKLEAAEKYTDFGLLVMRLGLGAAFMVHGWPKMVGGPQKWTQYGERLGIATGISFWPEFWGFMAAVAELGGGALLTLGLLTRPASLLLFVTMVVASLYHINSGDSFGVFSHALEASFVFFGLFFLGGGRFSLDQHLR